MSSGAVIYACHHVQDMRKMGGLRKKLPITFAAMGVATLAISGVPFFSGFVSKDQLLASTLAYGFYMHPQHLLLPILGFVTAGMTAFYMFRLLYMTFFGEARDSHSEHAHEVPWNMWLPLVVLAVLSLSIFYTASNWFNTLIVAPKLGLSPEEQGHGLSHYQHVAHYPAMVLSLILAAIGIGFSTLVFGTKKISAERLSSIWPKFVHKLVDNLYYFDFVYIKVLIQKVFLPFSSKTAAFDDSVIDRGMVDGSKDVAVVTQKGVGVFDDVAVDGILVDGVGGGFPTALGSCLRMLQNGRVQRYLLFAVSALTLVFLLRGTM